ncbi:tannase/feruloyl esterase family alpha/beta hydrolase [uncultured Xylophilus sp.]|uniref:tannase/feruloyl esterase family alpha/beta hydrolase n=1 Tax=uncultured Xylophilus sp. TaxID=296832 RepID=UPI0025DBF857|nr:tannase/feruloyl esterase family alpha/beta hydrolase [uncultured Xylophilus sp.]
MSRPTPVLRRPAPAPVIAAALAVAALSACGGGGSGASPTPQLAAAAPATLQRCSDLVGGTALANTTLTAATLVPAGTLSIAGKPVGEHCQVTGRMFQRTSPVDGQTYAIGFEMRLPRDWNGRFFHQVNGGTDGVVGTASGGIGGGGPLSNGLQQGFAVISSDAGHTTAQNPLFGLDPQARLDYGYQAVGKLTPMAKALIAAAYGKGPDRSYLVGCSNGGRHAMVGAARYADQYDGILAGNPGFNLPKAAVAQLYGAQQFNTVATDPNDLASAFTPAERALVASKVLEKCDALDGAADGLVQDVQACKTAFSLDRDVPSCSGASRTGACLSTAQKTALGNIFRGARNSAGTPIYASFPWDAGITSSNWAGWKFSSSIGAARDPVAVGFIFQVPPAPTSILADTKAFALGFSMDTDAPKIAATNALYTESSLQFMTPPNPGDLTTLRNRGAKMMVYHGVSDGVFSPDDTVAWYDTLRANRGGSAADFARLYLVPGMNHCSGGPATDQFDMVTALVDWVEKGRAPDQVIASARGTGNPGGVNTELPANWSAGRTRPLCPYPQVARYRGTGDPESAASFACQ